MDSDIQFGEVQFDQPDQSVRPDEDGHFAVEVVGEPPINDLPIFVDLDAMRDMEAHSLDDKTVELGGVMLGRRFLDKHGKPFVVVSDSLRADHYESDRSRFKFTHETWSDITRKRTGYPGETEMVGWYHTHPGWGIFLSGMDLFICNNFFNRPLDVALVIDPCNDDRGWFQWTDETAQKTRQTAGFYLMASRHRASELEYFADVYNGRATMNDPRYTEPVRGSSPIINVASNRNPMFDFALLGMLVMQFILLSIVAFRLLAPAPAPVAKDGPDEFEVAAQVKQLNIEKSAYQAMLQSVVDPDNQNEKQLQTLFSKFDEYQVENRRLASGYDAQLAHTEKLKFDNDSLRKNLELTQSKMARLETDSARQTQDLEESISRVKELESAIADGRDPDAEKESGFEFDFRNNWWWAALASVIVGIGSVVATIFYFRSKTDDEYYEENVPDNNPVSE